jgi:recombination protein RecR
MNSIPSRLLENAVDELAKMPGIGRRTAMRLALWILRQEKEHIANLGKAVIRLSEEATFCTECHNISDEPVCGICLDKHRDHTSICVVQDIRDVMAIEQTGQYKGLYHVLGGVISPLEGISPHDLNIETLIARIDVKGIQEVILAINPGVEGDTTAFYLFRKINEKGIIISTIARGVPVGDELEYADEVTLGRSILQRVPYEKGLKV